MFKSILKTQKAYFLIGKCLMNIDANCVFMLFTYILVNGVYFGRYLAVCWV